MKRIIEVVVVCIGLAGIFIVAGILALCGMNGQGRIRWTRWIFGDYGIGD